MQSVLVTSTYLQNSLTLLFSGLMKRWKELFKSRATTQEKIVYSIITYGSSNKTYGQIIRYWKENLNITRRDFDSCWFQIRCFWHFTQGWSKVHFINTNVVLCAFEVFSEMQSNASSTAIDLKLHPWTLIFCVIVGVRDLSFFFGCGNIRSVVASGWHKIRRMERGK